MLYVKMSAPHLEPIPQSDIPLSYVVFNYLVFLPSKFYSPSMIAMLGTLSTQIMFCGAKNFLINFTWAGT